MRGFKFWLVSLLSLSVVLFASCQVVKPQPVAKIVIALPLQQSVNGKAMWNAVQLLEREIQGRAGNHAVEFVYLDSSAVEGSLSSTDAEKETAQQAADDPDVVAYIGCASSARAKVAIPILNEAGVVTLSPSATWPGLTKPGFSPGAPGIFYPSGVRTFFRVAPTDDIQGSAAAHWAVQLGAKRVYIVDNENLYGQGVAGIFEVAAHDVGLEVIAHDSYNGSEISEAEVNSLAERIISTHPDLVFLGTSRFYGGGEVLAALRKRDPSIEVMVPDGMVKEQLLQEYPLEITDGVYGTGIALPADQLPSQKAVQFVTAYRDAYGEIPSSFAVNTYEATSVVITAISQISSSVNRSDVLQAMGNLGEYSGVLGEWSFADSGDMEPSLCSGWQVQDRTWKFVKVLK